MYLDGVEVRKLRMMLLSVSLLCSAVTWRVSTALAAFDRRMSLLANAVLLPPVSLNLDLLLALILAPHAITQQVNNNGITLPFNFPTSAVRESCVIVIFHWLSSSLGLACRSLMLIGSARVASLCSRVGLSRLPVLILLRVLAGLIYLAFSRGRVCAITVSLRRARVSMQCIHSSNSSFPIQVPVVVGGKANSMAPALANG
jgi:hypothetical protein